MNKFRHHPDGFIYINDDFMCTIGEWSNLEPGYSLPIGFIGREYKQNIEHRVYTSMKEKILGNCWEEGDEYFSKIDYYKLELEKIKNSVLQ